MLKVLEKLPKAFGHIYTMFLVLISWVIFAFEDLGQVGSYLGNMFGLNGTSLYNSEALYYLQNYIIIIIIGIICSMPLKNFVSTMLNRRKEKQINSNEIENKKNEEDKNNNKVVKTKVSKKQVAFAIVSSICYIGIILLSTASLVNNSFNPFLYFRF